MSNYADIDKLSWDEIQEPKVVPDGSWLLRLRGASYQEAKEEGKSDRVMFVHQPREPMDDVDADALRALGDNYDVTENKIYTTVFIEDGSSLFRVKKLLEQHGLTPAGNIKEFLKKTRDMKADVIGYLVTENFTRPDGSEGQKNVVKQFAKVDG